MHYPKIINQSLIPFKNSNSLASSLHPTDKPKIKRGKKRKNKKKSIREKKWNEIKKREGRRERFFG